MLDINISPPKYGWTTICFNNHRKKIYAYASYVYDPFCESYNLLKAIKNRNHYKWKIDQEGSILLIIFSKFNIKGTRIRFILDNIKIAEFNVNSKLLYKLLSNELKKFKEVNKLKKEDFYINFRGN